MDEEHYLPISAYGIIGDTRTAALVGRNGSIDWCCFPRFDSASVFGALLDNDRGGRFRIRPAEPYTSEQRYLSLTNILVTTFHTHRGTGVIEVTDFMPSPEQPVIAMPHEIHRRVRCLRGAMDLEILFQPRFGYGHPPVGLAHVAHGLVATGGGEVATLAAADDVAWTVGDDGSALGRLTMHARSHCWFVLRYDDDTPLPIEEYHSQERLERTAEFWNGWGAGLTYSGRYRAEVERSALTLKLLFYDPTGAVVAAPTTSLPEEIGGERNWDYRYCWLRDAAFTLSAFHIVGLYDEADRFMRYLTWVARKTDPLRIMYGIGGESELAESRLDHLEGYKRSRPVRVGNAAFDQVQLDVHGELLEAAYLWHRRNLIGDEFWELLRGIVDWVAAGWRQPDCGIWEVRREPRHYVFSKVMCWVALDRAIRMAEELDRPGDVTCWRQERDAIHAAVMRDGWSEQRGAFAQSFGSDDLDAANLLIPLVGFLPPDHPRVTDTIRASLRGLMRDGMLYRYTGDDGLAGREGVFAICTFWLANALILAGDVDDGERVFRRMLRFANRLGLYSEELDPRTGDFLGNFPQAFTHIALINTAELLSRAREGRAGEGILSA
jgi:GH15 family glucan-1,4-alpha-glucosidase